MPNLPYNQDQNYQPQPVLLEPAIVDHATGVLKLDLRSFNLDIPTYGNPQFLHSMASHFLAPALYAARKSDWDYNLRHNAQPILPFLFLGPAPVARDATFITSNGITMAIAVRSAQSAAKLPKLLNPSRFPSCADIETATFDVDTPYDVITRIKPIIKAMADHIEARNQGQTLSNINDIQGRILVFCESGNDRSPVLVAGFLMIIYGLPWQQALNFIHAHRFSVCLTTGMNEMLQTLEGMLKAEFDTVPPLVISNESGTLQVPHAVQVHRRVSKRSIDDAYDSDASMPDLPEVGIRVGIAPFIDGQLPET